MMRVKAAVLTADNPALSKAGTYYGARIVGDGTNAAAVVIYDNTSAAGTIIDVLRCTSTDSKGSQFPTPVEVTTGIYCDVTTVGYVIVWYRA